MFFELLLFFSPIFLAGACAGYCVKPGWRFAVFVLGGLISMFVSMALNLYCSPNVVCSWWWESCAVR